MTPLEEKYEILTNAPEGEASDKAADELIECIFGPQQKRDPDELIIR